MVILGYFFLTQAPPALIASSFSQKGNSLTAVVQNSFPESIAFTSFEVLSSGRLIKVGVPPDYPPLAPKEKRTLDFTFMHGCNAGEGFEANLTAHYRMPPGNSKKTNITFVLRGKCS